MYRYDAIAISMHVCVVDGGKISKISATGEAKNYMKYRCTEFRYAKGNIMFNRLVDREVN